MKLYEESNIVELLKSHNLLAKKYLGQNFLISKSALDTIVETAEIKETDEIIEVGPGLGVLTNELCKKAKKVTSIELDPQMIKVLQDTMAKHLKNGNLEILNQDALRFEPPKTQYKVVANIPYNITSPLINHFLRAENRPESITLLVQKEVANKICALDPKMTILALQVALFGTATKITDIPAESFHPAPKVDSAIITIKTHSPKTPEFIPTEEALKILKLAKQAFCFRRKKLSNTLSHLIGKTDIDLNRRPQTLSIKEWRSLI